MANKSSPTVAPRSRNVCGRCGRPLPSNSRPGNAACDKCRPPAQGTTQQRPASQPSSTDNSIPSAYLDLLDSRIAEYEQAAEMSDSNGQSATVSNAGSAIEKGPSKNKRAPHPQKSNSLVMNRFLNDTTEPDGVRDAILASQSLRRR